MSHDDQTSAMPGQHVIVPMPDEIDVTNADSVLALLDGALGPGVALVIADMTSTVFCDSAGVRILMLAQRKAAASGAELRLAMPPAGMVHRILDLMNLLPHMNVYPTTAAAAAG
jgi:anti-sigma B factor antagonist